MNLDKSILLNKWGKDEVEWIEIHSPSERQPKPWFALRSNLDRKESYSRFGQHEKDVEGESFIVNDMELLKEIVNEIMAEYAVSEA